MKLFADLLNFLFCPGFLIGIQSFVQLIVLIRCVSLLLAEFPIFGYGFGLPRIKSNDPLVNNELLLLLFHVSGLNKQSLHKSGSHIPRAVFGECFKQPERLVCVAPGQKHIRQQFARAQMIGIQRHCILKHTGGIFKRAILTEFPAILKKFVRDRQNALHLIPHMGQGPVPENPLPYQFDSYAIAPVFGMNQFPFSQPVRRILQFTDQNAYPRLSQTFFHFLPGNISVASPGQCRGNHPFRRPQSLP